MKKTKKAIKRGGFVGLEGLNFVLKPLHSSLISLLIIRLFSVDLWGQFVVFLVAVELMVSLLNWGQKPFLLREFSLRPNKIGLSWSTAIIARIPILGVIFLLLVIIPNFQAYILPLLIWVSFRWFSQLFESIIQFHRKYQWSIVAEIVALAMAACSIYFYSAELNIEQLLYVFAFSSIGRFLVLLPLFSNWKRPSFSEKILKKELLLSLPFFALALSGLLLSKGDLYVVTYYLQEQELASYQVMVGFLILGQTASSIILGPFLKNIYRWQGNDVAKLKKLYLKIGLLVTSIFSVALYFGLQFLYLIPLNGWHLLLFFAYLFPLYFYLIESQLLLKHKKEKRLLSYGFVAAFTNIAMSLLLVSVFGIYGALISGIIGRLVFAGLVVKRLKKTIQEFA